MNLSLIKNALLIEFDEDFSDNNNASSKLFSDNNEHILSNNIVLYLNALRDAVEIAIARVNAFAARSPALLQYFKLLIDNLYSFQKTIDDLYAWHRAKHIASSSNSSSSSNSGANNDNSNGTIVLDHLKDNKQSTSDANQNKTKQNDESNENQSGPDHTKRLFLAEAALLFLLPVAAKLLDCQLPRSKKPYASKTKPSNTSRRVSISEITPAYQWKYEGVSINSLMDSVESGSCSSMCSESLSTHQKDDAMILGCRIYACISLSEMIMKETANEDDDLILEKALGVESKLEVKGIETYCGSMYDEGKMRRNLDSFLDRVLWANAMVDAGYEYQSTFMRGLCFSTAGCFWGMPCLQSAAAHRGEACYATTPEEVATKKLAFVRYVWNLPETDLVRNFFKLGLPGVKYDHQFFIAPCSSYGPSMPLLEGGDEPVPCRIICDYLMMKLPSTITRELALGLPVPGPKNLKLGEPPSSTLILHFHGGGFIAMSSFSHENYTRRWSKKLRTPILSVDYRLAPDYVFPVPFNDSYRAYLWAISQVEEQLGYTPKKVILVGDSAGGNHAAAVTIKAIMDKKRIPDGLLLAYPAADLRRKFSPSMLVAFSDRLLPYVFAEACMAAYLGPDKEQAHILAQNPLVSPNMASSEILKQFPPTRIVVGDKDPIMDQSISFGHHLAREGVDVKIKIYPGMPHGFLSFGDWPIVGVQEVIQCVDDCAEILRELMKMSPKEDLIT